MKRATATRRRPAVHISIPRASRLHRLVSIISESPQSRDHLLKQLKIGLRTFYRELELLRRCGIKVRLEDRQYRLRATVAQAEERLPFPDPQLSFSELAELAQGSGAAARRLAALLDRVTNSDPDPNTTRSGGKDPRSPRRATP